MAHSSEGKTPTRRALRLAVFVIAGGGIGWFAAGWVGLLLGSIAGALAHLVDHGRVRHED